MIHPKTIWYMLATLAMIVAYMALASCGYQQTTYCPPASWKELGCYDYAPKPQGPPIVWNYPL